VVEKLLRKDGKTRFDLRPRGLREAASKPSCRDGLTISRKLRRIGAACDWRTAYTLSPHLSRAVRESVRVAGGQEEAIIYEATG